MIVPAGSPIVLRAPSIESYGGHVNKRDQGGIGVVNAQTDVSAAQITRMAEDMAQVAMMAELFRMTVHQVSSVIYVDSFRSLWGKHDAYYGATPPDGCIGATLDSGNLILSPPTSWTNSFNESFPIVIREAFCPGLQLDYLAPGQPIIVFSGWTNATRTIRGY